MFCCLTLYGFFDTGSMRTAKNEDGKTYYVPADMTYREWEKQFVLQKPPITSIRMLPKFKQTSTQQKEVENLTSQLGDRDKQLKDLKNSTDDVEGLKQRLHIK